MAEADDEQATIAAAAGGSVLDAATMSLARIAYSLGLITVPIRDVNPEAAQHIIDAVNAMERAAASLQQAIKVLTRSAS